MSDPDSPLNHAPSPTNPPTTDLTIASIPPPSKTSRRLPPPCWTLEETIALIDGYREKWHSLNRGNLKANHWEEVADSVGSTCPDVTPKKTAVQCRHKMEKLRKRYRTEIQRAKSVPVARFISSWIHYKRMEAMDVIRHDVSGDEDKDDGNYQSSFRNGTKTATRTTPRFFNRNGGSSSSSSSGGIRIRILTGVSIAQPGPRFVGKTAISLTPSTTNLRSSRSGVRILEREERVTATAGKRGVEDVGGGDDDPVVEIASAIKLLGDTMLRTEQTEMDMMREMETMRIDMEMKKTKMILESQQRIVEAFANSLSENTKEKRKKKVRRLSSDD